MKQGGKAHRQNKTSLSGKHDETNMYLSSHKLGKLSSASEPYFVGTEWLTTKRISSEQQYDEIKFVGKNYATMISSYKLAQASSPLLYATNYFRRTIWFVATKNLFLSHKFLCDTTYATWLIWPKFRRISTYATNIVSYATKWLRLLSLRS